MTDEAHQVRALVRPITERAGVDLVDVVVKHGRGRGLVRVVVDRKGGVPLGICRSVSAELSAALDEADPVEGRYALEVTSPGIDWPLEDRAAFDRVEGREVVVHHRDPDDADRVVQVSGQVGSAEHDAVVLLAPDGEVRIEYDRIVKATQKLPW